MFSLVTLLAAFLVIAPASSDCPNGWIEYSSTELCIKGFDQQMTYVESMDFCTDLGNGGSLVSIHNAFQNLHVATAANEANSNCNAWIGLYNIDGSSAYSWTDGSAVDYQNWAAGYPPSEIEDSTVFLDMSGKNKWVSTYNLAETRCFVCQQNSGQNPQTAPSTKTTTTTLELSTTTGRLSNCEDDWTYYEGFCYLWIEQFTYCQADAQAECARINSNLASIVSSAEQKFVNDFTHNEWAWIGLLRNGSWTWSDGSPLHYFNWQDGYPVSNSGYNYGATAHGTWRNQEKCDGSRILCKKPACDDGWTYNNGFCYFRITRDTNQTDAQAECVRKDSILASIVSSAELDFVHNFFGEGVTWIGLVRHESWEWIDGSPLAYTNWAYGNPKSVIGWDYAVMSDAQWYNQPCDAKYYALCKKVLHRVS